MYKYAMLWLFVISITCIDNAVSFSYVLRDVNKINEIQQNRHISKREVISPNPEQNVIKPDIYSFVITSNITYRYATTTVSNRVANPANVSQEVVFTVALPDSAFISGFLMVIKDKIYKAYVKEKEEAKKDYDDAVNRGETAGHVELSARDSNIFSVSVNVEANTKATFNLTYEQLLKRTLGSYENIINIDPGQVVLNFGIIVYIEESSNITSLEVSDLKTSNEIDSTDSKDINPEIEQPTGKTAKITWNPNIKQQQNISNSGVKGQLIVRYDVDRISNPSQILVDEGYFVHFYAPSDLKPLHKHVLFVLDVSGSMQGRKIEQLREALTKILGDLENNDFFSLILFSDSVQLYSLNGTVGEVSPSWNYGETKPPTSDIEINEKFIIQATPENVAKAKTFASTLNETGGTNIIDALLTSLKIADWGQKQYKIKEKPLIIFLTDGQPNVNITDPEEITRMVKKRNSEKYPLFSLAFGSEADYDFLRKLSLSNSGIARNIYVASDTSLQLNNFYKEVASPLLSNVTFEYVPGQISEETLTKTKFSNLFNGSELIVAGKLSNGVNDLNGNLTGQAFEGNINIPFPPILLPPITQVKGHLEKLWAYLYIKELLDKDLVSNENNSTYKQKALKLSLEYEFVTPLTSLVVVKPNETNSLAAPRNPTVQPEILNKNALIMPVSSNVGYSDRLYSVDLSLNNDLQISASESRYYLSGMAHPVASPQSNSQSLQPSQLKFFQPYSNGPPPPFPPQTIPIYLDEVDSLITTANIYNTSTVKEYSELNLTDILWLHDLTILKFPSSNNTYSIATRDLPDTEFQTCLIPNTNNSIGYCHHLAHCVLPEITISFEDFIPYAEQCIIDARFVGICCPKKIQKIQTSSQISNSTVTTASLLTSTDGITTTDLSSLPDVTDGISSTDATSTLVTSTTLITETTTVGSTTDNSTAV